MLIYKCSGGNNNNMCVAVKRRQRGVKKMENVENIFYANYDRRIVVNFDGLIIALWNAYIEEGGEGNRISLNNRDFFENSFKNNYDAAWAVSLSGRWNWKDEYACFDEEGHITSFNHWDDENSPIDPDRLDICQLIEGLKRWPKKKKEQEGCIALAIQDALK